MKNYLKKLLSPLLGVSAIKIPAVRLEGVISGQSQLTHTPLSLSSCETMLEKAFKDKEAPAVILIVNSPGGAPVQAHLIFKYIRQLADKNKKKVLVFVEDVAASGGYMIACAGDEIFADPASIVGSIGVISTSFGFTELIDKLGIKRRVYTAGKNKISLDPFLPEKEEDVKHLKEMQNEIHDHFIKLVQDSRKEKLADDKNIFTGMYWTGITAQKLGLIDHLDHMHNVIKTRYGEETKIKIIQPPKNKFLQSLKFLSKKNVGQEIVEHTISNIKSEDAHARYKL